MKKWLIVLLAVVAIAAATFRFVDGSAMVESKRQQNDEIIAESLAYHYGFLAYLYGYPIVDMARQMHNETHLISDEQQVYAPLNRFYRFPDLVTPATAGNLRAPNADTLYFAGWFDITDEPVIVHTPDTNGRYFTIAVTNQYAEAEHIGRRTTGTDEGYFALLPPHWQGELPIGVTPIPVETNNGWLLGRMYVAGRDDFANAKSLVDDVWMARLSEFEPGTPPLAPRPLDSERLDPLDSLQFFEVLNDALRTLPARPGNASLMAQLDAIGIGPSSDFDAAALDDATRAGLQRAIEDGDKVVSASTFRTIPDINGWMLSTDIGRYGHKFLQRASVVKGGYGNLPEESLYPAALYDADGNMLHGRNSYELHFAADALPPVAGFWSLSVYTLDAKLVPNAIERYSIGNLTNGLQFAADGSLTLRLQIDQPVEGTENWLPVPDEAFFAVLRMYEPAESARRLEYQIPRIRRLN